MPTLARLSFFLPPAQLDDFAALYDRYLTPLLQPHGLDSGFSDDRPYVAGVFSRLFAVETPSALIRIQQVLRHDSAWRNALKGLGERLDVSVRYHLGIYSTPAGEGRKVRAGAGSQRGQWHQYRVQDGLLSPATNAMLCDQQGHLWFATWEGVCRYDGESFTHFTAADGLASNPVQSMAEDPEGHLWFGTGWLGRLQGQGVTRYDGREFVTFTPADGLGHVWVGALTVDRQGRVWAGTEGGLSCFEEGRFSTYTTAEGLGNSRVLKLCADRQGRVWAGTDRGGLSCVEAGKITTFGEGAGLEHDKILSLLEDRQGRIWVGTEKGTSVYQEGRLEVFQVEGEYLSRVRALLEDEEGRLWLAPNPRGLRCWDGQGLQVYGPTEGLSGQEIVCLAADQQGRIWAGTQGGGVCYLERRTWRLVQPYPHLESLSVECLAEDRQGRLWLGTNHGLSCFDGREFMHLHLEEDTWHNLTRVVHEDRQGVVWSINYNGDVMSYAGGEWALRHENEWRLGLNAYSIAEDGQGHLWFANAGDGVLRYDGQTWRVFTAEDGLVDSAVRVVKVDRQGAVWFGTSQGGISRYDGERFSTISQGEELGFCPVWDILEDRHGCLWFATWGAGVIRYDGKGFRQYTRQEGLAYERVSCLWEDRRGHLWMGTHGGGVSRYDGRVFQTLGQDQGLVSQVVHDLLEDRQGRIWLATQGGLVQYRPSRDLPRVQIAEVVAERSHGPATSLSVPVSQELVQIEFQGSSATTPADGFVYVYRLAGYDPDWQVTHQPRVQYERLPLGEYTFQVQAVDRDLNYSETATVALEITPDPQAEALKEMVERTEMGGEFIGESAALRQVKTYLAQIAPTDMTVLILGETGTGKGITARLLHELSARKDGAFVPVACGAIPKGLEESDLFGHEKGAFTSAVSRKIGKVERAAGGTLFLDEIGDLPLETQGKLIQLLEERTFERVGGTQTLKSEARVIAATNRDLERMVREGTFRQDLFFRLQVGLVRLPPLRERREDILPLARHFIAKAAATLGKKPPGLTLELEALLLAYRWPGNVRQLKHLLDSAVVVCQERYLWKQHLPINLATQPLGQEEWVSLDENERRYILQVLDQTQGIIKGPKGAAAILGKHEATLRNRMRKLGIARKAG